MEASDLTIEVKQSLKPASGAIQHEWAVKQGEEVLQTGVNRTESFALQAARQYVRNVLSVEKYGTKTFPGVRESA